MAVIFLGSDHLVRVLNLRAFMGGDDAIPTEVVTATVTAQVKDVNGVPVGSPIALTYQPGTNGDYEGVVPYTLSFVNHATYTIEIVADDGPGRRRLWVLEAEAQYDMAA